jgi:hypothetical protein
MAVPDECEVDRIGIRPGGRLHESPFVACCCWGARVAAESSASDEGSDSCKRRSRLRGSAHVLAGIAGLRGSHLRERSGQSLWGLDASEPAIVRTCSAACPTADENRATAASPT